MSGKYLAIRDPSHHLANKWGLVSIHRIEAEKMLNRTLKDTDVVHHIDKNKLNNDQSNLMVFKSVSDHTSFHNGYKAILQEDGSYITEKSIKNSLGYIVNISPICNINYKYSSSDMCLECDYKRREKNIPSKENVEKLICNYSMRDAGKKYGVSDKAVCKWCTKYNLPNRYNDIVEYRKEHPNVPKIKQAITFN